MHLCWMCKVHANSECKKNKQIIVSYFILVYLYSTSVLTCSVLVYVPKHYVYFYLQM